MIILINLTNINSLTIINTNLLPNPNSVTLLDNKWANNSWYDVLF